MATPQRSTTSNSNRSASNPQTSNSSSAKARQYAHLNSQLAQLSANMADFENIMKMTAVHAKAMRELGGYAGAMLMASSKILGEEMVARSTAAEPGVADDQREDHENS